jgi:putative tricarboxylic transport membrane protein
MLEIEQMFPQNEPPSSKCRVHSDFIVGLFLLVFALVTILESRKLAFGGIHSPGPGFFPFLLGCLVAFLSLILLTGYIIRRVEVQRGQWEGLLWQKVVAATVILLAYSLTLEIIGFLLGTFLLLGFLLRLIEKKSISFVLFLSFLISLGTYFIFKFWLYIQLPRGIIPF